MVDLPSYSRGVVTSEAPVSRISGAEVAQPYQELGRALDKSGDALEAVATPLAERAGLEAVTVDNEGNLKVDRAPIFGAAGAAFSRAVKYSAVAQGEGMAKRDDIALRKQFLGDPGKYAEAADNYRKKMVDKYTEAAGPEVGLTMGKIIDAQTTYSYRSMELQKEHQIRQAFDHGTQARIESKSQDLADLIRTGGADTPQATQLAAEVHHLVEERVNNPILGESPDIADLRIKKLQQDIGIAGFEHRIGNLLKNPATDYQPLIEASAKRYNVEPALLNRLIYQESAFNPNAVSSAGATGIAQFMPATAARYGVNPRDAQSSIEGAAHYLNDLQRQFGGNTGLALAGYNWGEGNVARWMASGANPAAMPAETRNYVMSITGMPIQNWIRGDRAEPGLIRTLPPSGGPLSGIARAQQAVTDVLDDERISPTERILFNQAGQKVINDFRTDIARQNHVAQEQQKAVDKTFEDAVIADRASDNPQITENDIKTNRDVSPESRMRMLRWIKTEDLPEPLARVSEQTSVDLFRRMSLPDGDPQKISDLGPVRDAYIAGQLKRQDEEWLEKRFNEGRSEQGQKLSTQIAEVVKASALDKSTLMKLDEEGGREAQYRYQQYVLQRVDDYRKAGKNPAELFNPNSPDFIGKREIVDYFRPTAVEVARNAARQMQTQRPPPPPGLAPVGSAAAAPGAVRRNPGESPADFLRRTAPVTKTPPEKDYVTPKESEERLRKFYEHEYK